MYRKFHVQKNEWDWISYIKQNKQIQKGKCHIFFSYMWNLFLHAYIHKHILKI